MLGITLMELVYNGIGTIQIRKPLFMYIHRIVIYTPRRFDT